MRTRLAEHVHGFVRLLLSALVLTPAAAQAGGQGVTLPAVAPPTDTELHRFLMNEPGVPVPRFVCVDDPATECFELAQDPAYLNNAMSTRLTSPDCPAGPNTQACMPDAVGSARGRVELDFLPQDQWTYQDVSASYATPTCASGDHDTTIVTPAGYATAADLSIGSAVYANTNAWFLTSAPASLDCAEWIRTDSGDVNNTGVQLIFTLGRTARVTVAYDADATVLPNWLTNNTSPTGETIVATGPLGAKRLFALYRSDALIPKGTDVTLGGNANQGADGAFMYLAMVRPADAVEACGSLDATISIEQGGGAWLPVQTIQESGCGVLDLNGGFLEPPILIPGGLGWWAGDPLLGSCDGLFFGFEIQAERSLLVSGALDRAAFVDAAQVEDPSLCDANGAGICQKEPAMTLVEANGTMQTLAPLGGQAFDCTFDVTFTPPGTTRIVERDLFPNLVVDEATPTLATITPPGAGVYDDLDVWFETSANHADNLSVSVSVGGQGVLLHDRPGCDTGTALIDQWFDDESVVPPLTWTAGCGTLASPAPVQPIGSLADVDGELVGGPIDLELVDAAHPGDGTELLAWGVRATTIHTQCSDDLDNDGDGRIDFDGGPDGGLPDVHCVSAEGDREAAPPACGVGPELALVLAGLAWARGRARRT